MNRRLIIMLGAILFVLPLLAGCGSGNNPTLAVVGGQDITLADFNLVYGNLRTQYATAEEEFEGKKKLLDSMVVTRLLINSAYDKNIDKIEELARIVLASRNQFLLDALYENLVIKKAEPSDAEVKDFYNKLEYQIRASHILLRDADTAQAIFERVKTGENFEKLAYDYSIDPSAKKNRGDLGYFLWGAMVEQFQTTAFAMEPGEVSRPIKSRFGYHIIKVVDKAPNDLRREFETIKDSLEIRLVGLNRRKILFNFLDSIKVAYNVTVDTATCDYLLYKRRELFPPTMLATLPKNDFSLEHLDRNEKELVLASWEGGQITLLEYLSLIQRYPSVSRPDFDDYDSLKAFIFRLKTNEILSLEATKLGLDEGEYFKHKIAKFKELNMADIMRTDSIPRPSPPTEEDARNYYMESPEEFTQPMKIHVYEIYLNDELKARQLRNSIRSLRDFREKAGELTERPGKRSVGGDLQYIEERWYPEIFALAKKTPAGNIAGPVPTRGKYSVIWVADKLSEQIKDFLTVKREILNKLTRKGLENAFANWVALEKSKTTIELMPDELWTIIDKSKYVAQNGAGSEG